MRHHIFLGYLVVSDEAADVGIRCIVHVNTESAERIADDLAGNRDLIDLTRILLCYVLH